jgi:DNA uptake protein ComE-like DNA-binding protein
MRRKINDFFDFAKTESRGIMVLLVLVLILIASNIIISKLSINQTSDFASFQKEIITFESRQKFLADSIAQNRKKWGKIEKDEVSFFSVDKSIIKNLLTPFPFNPNNLSEELWKKMGLSDKQIKSIKNFESKGGKFKTKEDFQKMYTISAEEYSIIEPFITIPQDSVPKYTPKKVKFASVKIDLNIADTNDLQKIPGIGPSLARRIYNQRLKLGGFYEMDQLNEIYGIDSARYAKVTPFLFANQSKITKININTADVKELVKHPYLDLYMAKSIVVHRNKIGKYTSVAQIKNAALIYDELYQKLFPYLSIE